MAIFSYFVNNINDTLAQNNKSAKFKKEFTKCFIQPLNDIKYINKLPQDICNNNITLGSTISNLIMLPKNISRFAQHSETTAFAISAVAALLCIISILLFIILLIFVSKNT